jgi:hypothetical protein
MSQPFLSQSQRRETNPVQLARQNASLSNHIYLHTDPHRICPRCEILCGAFKGHQLFKCESLVRLMSVSNASMNSDSNLRRQSDQRASVTLTADTAMGMVITVEEAHCLLGTSTGQPASVLLYGRLRRPYSFIHHPN